MERNLSDIVRELGKEYGLEQSTINNINSTLQREFYIKLKHIKNLSADTWKSLKLPLNLYYVIKDMYESALSNSHPVEPPKNTSTVRRIYPSSSQNYPSSYPNNNYSNENKYRGGNTNSYSNQYRDQDSRKYPNYNSNSQYENQYKSTPSSSYNQNSNNRNYNNQPSSSSYQRYPNSGNNVINSFINNRAQQSSNNYNNHYNNNSANYRSSQQQPPRTETIEQISGKEIYSLLSDLYREINNMDLIKKVFKQLYMIITNITHHPNDEKYRKFNINKLLSAYNYRGITYFFTRIGFKKVDDYMYLIGKSEQMSPVMTELNSFIKINKIAESSFDPYKGSISSLAGNEDKIRKINSGSTNFEDLYNEEIDRRNRIIRQTKVERNPKYFLLKNNFSLGKLQSTFSEIDDDLISNTADDRLIYQHSMELIKLRQNDRFTLKSRTRFEQLMKTPIYIKSDIRLKFPDESILQGSFALYEPVGNIYAFIKDFLVNSWESFNISTTPPLKRYLKKNNTLQEENLFPNILMYVNFDDKFSGLNKNKTSRYISPME